MVLLGSATVVVVAAGSLWWLNRPAPAAAEATRTVAASVGTMRLTTSTTGTLAAAAQANLSFGVSGQVTAVDVTVGQKVTAGQKLAAVSSASLTAQVAQSKASLAQAKSRLSADSGGSATSAQLAADQAAVTAAQSALDNVEASLADATLTSPIAGTVAAVDLTVGQQVAGGSSGGSGGSSGGSGGAAGGAGGSSGGTGASGGSGGSSGSSSSAQVVVLGSAFVVNASIDSTQIGLVKKGEQAVIVPQGSATPQYGTVTSVGLLGSATSGVTTFPVVISVTGTPTGLFAGATASVSIVYKQLNDVLEIPTAAVHYGSGQPYVQLAGASGTGRANVTVGISSGGFIQITSGLTEGQEVVVPVIRSTGTSGGSGTSGTGGRTGFGGGGFGGGGGGGGTGRTGGGAGGGTGAGAGG